MAFTESQQFLTVLGDKYFGSYKLTGDGSDTTWSAPLAQIDGAWVQEYNTGSTGASLTFTLSGNSVTFGRTLASTEIVHIFFVGI